MKNPSLCTAKLKNEDWNTYLSFYNHVDNLCFYYRGIIWQEESEKMINSLFDSASISKNMLYCFLIINKIMFSSLHNLEKTNEISKMHTKIDEDLQRHFMDVLKNNEEIRVI